VNEKKNGRERWLTEVDFTEGSTSDLAAELVAAANDALHVLKREGFLFLRLRQWTIKEKPEPQNRVYYTVGTKRSPRALYSIGGYIRRFMYSCSNLFTGLCLFNDLCSCATLFHSCVFSVKWLKTKLLFHMTIKS